MSNRGGLPAMMDSVVRKHARDGFRNMWVRKDAQNQTYQNAHIDMTKQLGWQPVAGDVVFGDVQLFEMPTARYVERQKEKSEMAMEDTRGGRITAALEVEKQALKEKHAFPTGNDGGEIDYDKKYSAKGEKIAIRGAEE